MKIAIVCSNFISITKAAKKGTEIFDYILINNLLSEDKNLDITAFASGDSDLPVKIESVDYHSSVSNKSILQKDKHIIFELALISKAFSMQDNFDLYHINIGDGDIALPFAPFVKKPILITMHYTHDTEYINKYFSLFKNYKNIYFVSISNAQRKFFPDLNYKATIYHGIETDKFIFNPLGGENIMWAGRAIPEKGIDIVVEVADRVKHEAKLFGIQRKEHTAWLQKTVHNKIDVANRPVPISLEIGLQRLQLVEHFQTSKLFLFPVGCEESFGLVLIEAMSCGTPVVAYAKGSIPEIIKDGKTGFIVNSSDNDIRGDWIVKKTGIDGLCEAIDKIYSMPKKEYQEMRNNCRSVAEESFSVNRIGI
ncbi:MAG: Group 1 glycosyl transferase [Candidatus Levybacteria bacterium GW2011_GWB1_35_5]|nr:MAG: Group 1 glycosyl transferase [Candidatus Levybacteria bacterium GW2011_GWB1_35_5]